MEKKITFLSQASCWIDENSLIGNNVIIYPSVVIEGKCLIGDNVTIQTGTIIKDNCVIEDNCFIGSNCLIRNNTIIKCNSTIGSGCELKQSSIGKNCNIGHKNFIGNAILEDNVKFGFGAVTANFDGTEYHNSYIGQNTFIGCNCVLIAPIRIGKNCILGAGLIIKKNVEDNMIVYNKQNYVYKTK